MKCRWVAADKVSPLGHALFCEAKSMHWRGRRLPSRLARQSQRLYMPTDFARRQRSAHVWRAFAVEEEDSRQAVGRIPKCNNLTAHYLEQLHLVIGMRHCIKVIGNDDEVCSARYKVGSNPFVTLVLIILQNISWHTSSPPMSR
jgi:hypothetical protein